MRGRMRSPEMRRNNVPPGTLIYDVNWSDFPKLFFYDARHNYVSSPEWLRYMMKTGKFQTVYEDNECMILHVLD
jgi:hypothetical protein